MLQLHTMQHELISRNFQKNNSCCNFTKYKNITKFVKIIFFFLCLIDPSWKSWWWRQTQQEILWSKGLDSSFRRGHDQEGKWIFQITECCKFIQLNCFTYRQTASIFVKFIAVCFTYYIKNILSNVINKYRNAVIILYI